jgi:SAM-dependent methyltransferase
MTASQTPAIPQLFDRKRYLMRREKANGAADMLLMERIMEDLVERLLLTTKPLGRALVLTDRRSLVEPQVSATRKFADVQFAQPREPDALQVPDAGYDCIISLLDLHAVNDVPGQFAQLARALKPDGLLQAAFFAGETLTELRQSWLAAESEITGGASYRVAPMIGVRELGALLQRAGLALPVTDVDHAVLRYDNALALMQEVKSLGYANPMLDRSRKPVTRQLLTRVAEIYQQRFADADGRIRATIDIAWAHAWKPHESQQKPLKPGSAKARLADALKVREEKI